MANLNGLQSWLETCFRHKWSREAVTAIYYNTERRQTAEELIAFGRHLSRLFSGRPSTVDYDKDGIDLESFKDVFDQGNAFSSGLEVKYKPIIITTKDPDASPSSVNQVRVALPARVGEQHLAKYITIRKRIPSYKILINQTSGPGICRNVCRTTVLGISSSLPAICSIKRSSSATRNSERPSATPRASFTDIRESKLDMNPCLRSSLFTQAKEPLSSLDLLSLLMVVHPYEEYGWDYDMVFTDDASYHERHGQAYENYGIDPSRCCSVVGTPDHYVNWIGELEDADDLAAFFDTFLI